MYFPLLNPCLQPLFPTVDPSQRGTKDEATGAVSVGASVLTRVFSCVYMYLCLAFICMPTERHSHSYNHLGQGSGAMAASPLSAQPNSDPWGKL